MNDAPESIADDWTGSDAVYTNEIVDFLQISLVPMLRSKRALVYGASGGCVTAASLAEQLLDAGLDCVCVRFASIIHFVYSVLSNVCA